MLYFFHCCLWRKVSNPIRESQNFVLFSGGTREEEVSNPIRESQNVKGVPCRVVADSFKPYKGKSKFIFSLILVYCTIVSNPIRESQNMNMKYINTKKRGSFKPYKGKSKFPLHANKN